VFRAALYQGMTLLMPKTTENQALRKNLKNSGIYGIPA
jgi:hypothetical protein